MPDADTVDLAEVGWSMKAESTVFLHRKAGMTKSGYRRGCSPELKNWSLL
jgi:hypothetical protein